ncbi:rnc [Lepeophtheirus salmonis]|uniref:Ribonuclease 3 n=1 Tax=Lepeophtheirus salmonis TaxID=72036 RepID=A0A7R8CG74_LEPSM|nr:rnc [Lepeophtheirus salmonis]CAF2813345.1 rnc [Lepeophtheirus salmonis]
MECVEVDGDYVSEWRRDYGGPPSVPFQAAAAAAYYPPQMYSFHAAPPVIPYYATAPGSATILPDMSVPPPQFPHVVSAFPPLPPPPPPPLPPHLPAPLPSHSSSSNGCSSSRGSYRSVHHSRDLNKDRRRSRSGNRYESSRHSRRSPDRRRSRSREDRRRRSHRYSRSRSPSRKRYREASPAPPILDRESKSWIRSSSADLYYAKGSKSGLTHATPRLLKLIERFQSDILERGNTIRSSLCPPYLPLKINPNIIHKCKGKCEEDEDDSESESDSDEEAPKEKKSLSERWMDHRIKQKDRLHEELWGNRPGELNDGPACRCSIKSRSVGIRHQFYKGEDELPKVELDSHSNNVDKLYHYRLSVSPSSNFMFKEPTSIRHDEHDYVFDGFSLLTTSPLPNNLPIYLVDWRMNERFYFMPRFVRRLQDNGKEILSMNAVLEYCLKSNVPLVDEIDLGTYCKLSKMEWQNTVADQVRGMIVMKPGAKPPAVRVDQLDREGDDDRDENEQVEALKGGDVISYPVIVHFGVRPAQLCFSGNLEYQKTWKDYKKFRHLLANMPKPSLNDKATLEEMEDKLMEIRAKLKNAARRHCHSQFSRIFSMHSSLDYFEKRIKYKFKNRYLLQLAVTHPSYKENYGTTSDHARNTITNCGIRSPEFGDRRVHYATTRKRGINTLIHIMSRFGKSKETESRVRHNERLEFLGDAVVEFITSVHLFHMFPDLEEGGLATYRAALVQNQHFAILAQKLELERYMLYAHGADLCHDSELRHAMSNCFEAVMGSIFLDGGIDVADRVFADALFGGENFLLETWIKIPPHPLQIQEPEGDRSWIEKYPLLQKLTRFEDMTGIIFTHIRLLARAFTDRSIGFSNLTLGSNQRLEFLGDTVLQLITSDYLYKYFPEHHEGHLSLLRSSIVNNRTQSVVCDDLGIPRFARFSNPKADLKTKDKADLLEALIGAIYVDKDLNYCRVFAEVCFFPRLQQFILNQEWNDPKSKLQQCCLTLRSMSGKDPDIPIYKVIESKGPTNTRVYIVAVYFRGERLAKSSGPSIQQAEMNAAKDALENCKHLFPHLKYQKRVVERSFSKQSLQEKKKVWEEEVILDKKNGPITPSKNPSLPRSQDPNNMSGNSSSNSIRRSENHKSSSSMVTNGSSDKRGDDHPPSTLVSKRSSSLHNNGATSHRVMSKSGGSYSSSNKVPESSDHKGPFACIFLIYYSP